MIVTKPTMIIAWLRLHNAYYLDVRSLALFRILVALVVLTDLVQRLGDATVLYSDAGVLPRASAIPIAAPDRWSILFLNGSPEFAVIVIIVGVIAAGLMIVGRRTRTATIVLWAIVVSLQARNNHLAYGADTLIRLSLFWGMFLPLGAVWSFDRQHAPNPTTTFIVNLATFGLLIQTAFMYLFTALLKEGSHWRVDFDAVYYALGMRDLSTWLGEWLFLNAPSQFFAAATAGTLWMEFAVPIMLLIPFRVGWFRMISIVLVLALHMGIGTTMSVGLFPAISIASIMVVLPSGFWEFVFAPKFAPLLTLARLGRFSPDSRFQANDPQPTMPFGNQILSFLPSHQPDSKLLRRYAFNLICVSSIGIGLLWNITTVSSYELPSPLRRSAVVAGLYQDWGMFAPDPRPLTRWFVIDGNTSSGENIDLMVPIMESEFQQQQPPVWDQSDNVLLRNERWRKYFFAIQNREVDGLKMASFICRSWNAENSGDDRLQTVRFTVASAATLSNSQRADPVYQQVGLWYCD